MLRPRIVQRLAALHRRPFHTLPDMRNNDMTVCFLGTNSGGGPTPSRNCSSLVADIVGDGSLWMVDCAEGTLRQFVLQPARARHFRAHAISKIFITHMHADHVMGIGTMLRSILDLPRDDPLPPAPAKVEMFGPAGLRTFVRSILKMTKTRTAHRYVVHELLAENDETTPCDPPDVLHSSENVGRDIQADGEGFWRIITTAGTRWASPLAVDAGPIEHRDPCIGYVVRELHAPSRKLVFLGDTSNASAIIPLCTSPSPSLLVHEATDSYIPRSIDPKAKRTAQQVEDKAVAKGHSTAAMAGAFAKKVGATMLLLNHISARFPPAASWSRKQGDVRGPVIQEIERQASEAWGMGRAIAAVDYMQVVVPGVVRPNDMSSNPGLEFGNAAASEDPEHGGSGERSGNKRKRARVRKALGADYDVGGGDGGDDDDRPDDSRAG